MNDRLIAILGFKLRLLEHEWDKEILRANDRPGELSRETNSPYKILAARDGLAR